MGIITCLLYSYDMYKPIGIKASSVIGCASSYLLLVW